MAKYLKIQIPKHCGESWEAMHPQKQGKFCNSCEKVVIDFSKMTDEQLIRFFKKSKDNVCGRFASNQLDMDILIAPKKIPWLKYFFRITIPAFLFSSKVMAQGEVKVQEHSLVSQTTQKQTSKSLFAQRAKTVPGIRVEETVYADKILIEARDCEIKDNKYSSTEPGTAILQGRVGGVVSEIRIQRKNIFKLALTRTNKVFSIFPNPAIASSHINIVWPGPVKANQTIEIYTEAGVLLQKEILTPEENTKRAILHLKELQPATYTIKITDNKTHKSSARQFILL